MINILTITMGRWNIPKPDDRCALKNDYFSESAALSSGRINVCGTKSMHLALLNTL